MSDTLIVAVFVVGAVLCAYPFTGILMNVMDGDRHDPVSWGLLGMAGTAFAVLWPLILVGVGGYLISKALWDRVIPDRPKVRR